MSIKPFFASPRRGRAAVCWDFIGISWMVFAETAVGKKKKKIGSKEGRNKCINTNRRKAIEQRERGCSLGRCRMGPTGAVLLSVCRV